MDELKASAGPWRNTCGGSLARGDKDGWNDLWNGVWRDTSTRAFSATIDGLTKVAQMLGVPVQQLWSRIPGVTAEDVQAWLLAAQREKAQEIVEQAIAQAQQAPAAQLGQAVGTPTAAAVPRCGACLYATSTRDRPEVPACYPAGLGGKPLNELPGLNAAVRACMPADAFGQVLLQQCAGQQRSRACCRGNRRHVEQDDSPRPFQRWLADALRSRSPAHYDATAANAAQYYVNSRVIAGLDHVSVPGQDPDMSYISHVTDAMGPGQFYNFLPNYDADAASSMARDALRGAGTRMVMMGGRDTVTHAVRTDKLARGWERVIEPGACGFCAMLAGRGAVYKESTVDFRAHDHCVFCVGR